MLSVKPMGQLVVLVEVRGVGILERDVVSGCPLTTIRVSKVVLGLEELQGELVDEIGLLWRENQELNAFSSECVNVEHFELLDIGDLIICFVFTATKNLTFVGLDFDSPFDNHEADGFSIRKVPVVVKTFATHCGECNVVF